MMNEDKELVRKTLAGEKKAYEAIIIKYQRPLLNYICRALNDYELALEFTQDVFIKTYSALHTYNSNYSFKTWIYTIATNHVGDYWRKKKIDTIPFDQLNTKSGANFTLEVPSREPTVSNKFELSEIMEKIEETLYKLPTHLKELFICKHYNELSYNEISAIKGIPVGTIKNRIYKTKTMLRQQLEGIR